MTTSVPAPRGAGLLIGDVARLSGLTPRAIRHYHAVGLVIQSQTLHDPARTVALALRDYGRPSRRWMHALLGDRLTDSQRPFMRQLRDATQAHDA